MVSRLERTRFAAWWWTIDRSLLTALLTLMLAVNLPELGSDPWPFRPGPVDASGPLGPAKRAEIIALAEVLSDVPKLYSAGANFVSVPRVTEAKVLCEAIRAAREARLEHHRTRSMGDLNEREEVIG